MEDVFIPTDEVIKKYKHLIKGKGSVCGIQFAKEIVKSGIDLREFRENCASTAASVISEIIISETGHVKVSERIF
ncbi:hypothetical protein [Prevotella corporis]|uniref:hypothetical protein n=1 Tax=Prevotella corporis TaxID=28128 RepID=UPI0023F8FFC6|nr:hypothetical protein [Prevotella corporis]